jgi:glutamate 5-kinase
MQDKAVILRKQIIAQARRIVIKLGTATLVQEGSGIQLSKFYAFGESIAKLKSQGKEVLIVSSGAIALGADKLKSQIHPERVAEKRACAAVGQGLLMSLYAEAFERFRITTAQILLTEEDFSNRHKYLSLQSTINELIYLGVIPVINENDTVSSANIGLKKTPYFRINFGDNDKLAALVASKIDADLLLILTDVDGLYTANPKNSPDAKFIPIVESITPEIEMFGCTNSRESIGKSKQGRGGIATKIEAAKVATQSGCATIVASGEITNIIGRIWEGDELGTLFLPQAHLTGKHRWIAFATTVRASLMINGGAAEALLKRKASLLPAGIIKLEGEFDRGDVVSIVDENKHEFARGMANYSSSEISMICGMRSSVIDEVIENRNYDAVITRDNLVILNSNINDMYKEYS